MNRTATWHETIQYKGCKSTMICISYLIQGKRIDTYLRTFLWSPILHNGRQFPLFSLVKAALPGVCLSLQMKYWIVWDTAHVAITSQQRQTCLANEFKDFFERINLFNEILWKSTPWDKVKAGLGAKKSTPSWRCDFTHFLHFRNTDKIYFRFNCGIMEGQIFTWQVSNKILKIPPSFPPN